MSTATLPRLLTAAEVALWLVLPSSRVERMGRAGQIPCLILPDGSVLFEAAVLAEWVKSRRAQGGPSDAP
jgi:hypothetical protein